jgi:hypothetical protein
MLAFVNTNPLHAIPFVADLMRIGAFASTSWTSSSRRAFSFRNTSSGRNEPSRPNWRRRRGRKLR